MLKTSSTELAEPRKGVVGVSGSGRNRAEPVGKHEVDEVHDGGGSSGDFDRKSHPRLQYGSHVTHLDAQNELINGLKRPRLRSSMMRLMLMASRSKNRQKVKESSKSPKASKV